ncbi:MAG: neutral zinc metallopeptidase [Candidatus Accumulibacter propinquus]
MLRSTAAIGEDRRQRQTQGQVVAESFTHGTSSQRVCWFKRCMDSGGRNIRQCDSFSPKSL